MHPLLLRRLRPVAAVILVFFTWFSIEPWNFALAAQDLPTSRVRGAAVSEKKILTAPEAFEDNLRLIKDRVRAARDGDAYQAQLAGLLKSLDQAVAQSSRELEATRQAVDSLARAVEQGAPAGEAIKALKAQHEQVNTAVGQVRLNAAGIEGLLRGLALPAGLTQSQKQAKDAVTGLSKTLDTALTAISRRAEQQRGFDAQEHQAFLAASMELAQGLAAVQVRVQALATEATPERRRAQLWEEAYSKRESLLSADQEIRREFDQTEAFLKEKGLPQEILDRHEAAVSDYEKNFTQLKGYFTQVDQAHRAYVSATERGNETAAQTTERDLESRLTAFDDFLKANVKDPPHQPLDPNNLPHRTPKPQERKPRLKKEEFAEFQSQIRLAYNGDPVNLLLAQATLDLPKPEDLAQTIEVQFTTEIQALAAQLEHNPVKIYNWVRNNIDFVPTYGSIQGAHMCLMTKQCNDMDTASLLIALLRNSGIAARYVIGTIEVPIEQVMNWVGGFTDERAALNFIASGGTPVTGLTSGGKLAAARMEHVWVEAYVDYIPSRGAVHKQGDTWIPLDGSFKQYDFTVGVNLASAVAFDALALVNQVRSGATVDDQGGFVSNINTGLIQSTVTDLQNRLREHISTSLPQATVDDVLGKKTIRSQQFSMLPGILPYTGVVLGARFSSVAVSLQHRLVFELSSGIFGPSLTYTAALSYLLGRRVTLSYVPATADDQTIVDLFGGLYQAPAYLVQVKPQLRIDGAVATEGSPAGLGTLQNFSMTFTLPSTGVEQVRNEIIAGGYYALGLVADRLPLSYIAVLQGRSQHLQQLQNSGGTLPPDDVLGEELYLSVMTYFWQLDRQSDAAASSLGISYFRLPGEGIFSLSLAVSMLFGVPKSVRVTGETIDVDRVVYIPVTKDGEPNKARNFMVVSGISGSGLENAIIEEFYAVEAISAVKAIYLANTLGYKIYKITSANLDLLPLLQIPESVKTDIRNAAGSGKEAIVPERTLQLQNWQGLGYVVSDPVTGAAGYLISGGFAGGSGTVEQSLTDVLKGIANFIKALERLAAIGAIVATLAVFLLIVLPAFFSAVYTATLGVLASLFVLAMLYVTFIVILAALVLAIHALFFARREDGTIHSLVLRPGGFRPLFDDRFLGAVALHKTTVEASI